jgi:hypothetical protein
MPVYCIFPSDSAADRFRFVLIDLSWSNSLSLALHPDYSLLHFTSTVLQFANSTNKPSCRFMARVLTGLVRVLEPLVDTSLDGGLSEIVESEA